jgi:sugar phosphate isomerase/epimerase
LQVYKTAKSWEGLPNSDQLANLQDRMRLIRQKRRVREAAAAAGVPLPGAAAAAADTAGPSSAAPLVATKQAAAAAAATTAEADAGPAEDAEEEGDDVHVVGELSGDALLQLKRQAAARAGLLIDLSLDADVTDENELEAANMDLLKVRYVLH